MRGGVDGQVAAERRHALLQTPRSAMLGSELRQVVAAVKRKAAAVVFDRNAHRVILVRKRRADTAGGGMLRGVGQPFRDERDDLSRQARLQLIPLIVRVAVKLHAYLPLRFDALRDTTETCADRFAAQGKLGPQLFDEIAQ